MRFNPALFRVTPQKCGVSQLPSRVKPQFRAVVPRRAVIAACILARSLAKRPKLLLLDEPLGALDAKLRQRTQLELVDIIHQVEATTILGYHRPNLAATLGGAESASANMLELAKGLCAVALPDPHGAKLPNPSFSGGTVASGARQYPFITTSAAPFVTSTGDWEMWMNLCNRFSPPVVRVYVFHREQTQDSTVELTDLRALYYAAPDLAGGFEGYPQDAPVLDHNKRRQLGVNSESNFFPACYIVRTGDEMSQATLDQFQKSTSADGVIGMPPCPDRFIRGGKRLWQYSDDQDEEAAAASNDRIKEWTIGGAINTGMSVFSYLSDRTAFDPDHPAPYYNECQLLP